MDYRSGEALSDKAARKVSSSAAATHAAIPTRQGSSLDSSTNTPSDNSKLVDMALSPHGGGVWSTRRAMVQVNRQAQMKALAHHNDDPLMLAERVGELAAVNSFDEALKIVETLSKLNKADALNRISHVTFMRSAASHLQPSAALSFLHVLPKRYHSIKLHNMALQVCATARDYARALEVLDLIDLLRMKKDAKLMTSMINVCASIGNAERAFKYFADIKAEYPLQVDGKVYGSLIAACAEAMLREMSVVHERKDQYVLLERAFQVAADAEKAGLNLEAPIFNSLLVCSGRSGQIGRAFEVLDMMVERGIRPDALTHGALIEACVQVGKKDLALKIFNSALKKGFGDKVEIYTAALSACKIEGSVDLPRALEIHSLLERSRVAPDKKFYAALVAVAGKASRMDLALEAVNDYVAEGMPLSTTLVNALIYAAQNDLALMRRIYDYSITQEVYPEISQYNRMLDWYASQARLGEVVSLVCDLVKSGRVPNLNTYRIILNACQRSEQGQLALAVFSLLRSKRIPILQHKFAQSIYYTVLKVCFGQIRQVWLHSRSAHQAAPWLRASGPQVIRIQESEALIHALKSAGKAGASISGRAAPSEAGYKAPSSSSSDPALSILLSPLENVDWQRHAVMSYRDLVTSGVKPSLDVIDMILNCLRIKQHKAPPQPSSSASDLSHGGGSSSFGSSLPSHLANGGGGPPLSFSPFSPPGNRGALGGHVSSFGTPQLAVAKQPWEVLPGFKSTEAPSQGSNVSWFDPVFDQRALSILEDAINKGHLPINIKGVEEGPSTIDLCGIPPTLAEVIVMAVLSAFERRAVKTGRCQVFHNVTFLVPSFNPDYVMWPSYVDKVHLYYEEQQQLQQLEGAASNKARSEKKEVGDDHLPQQLDPDAVDGDDALFKSPGGSLEDEDEEMVEGGPSMDFTWPSSPSPSSLASYDYEIPLTATEAAAAAPLTSSHQTPASTDLGSSRKGFRATHTTGLAVAATCRRMKIFSTLDPARGIISLGSKELSRWLITRRSYEMRDEGGMGGVGAARGGGGVPSGVSTHGGRTDRGGHSPGSQRAARRAFTPPPGPHEHPEAPELTFRLAPNMIIQDFSSSSSSSSSPLSHVAPAASTHLSFIDSHGSIASIGSEDESEITPKLTHRPAPPPAAASAAAPISHEIEGLNHHHRHHEMSSSSSSHSSSSSRLNPPVHVTFNGPHGESGKDWSSSEGGKAKAPL